MIKRLFIAVALVAAATLSSCTDPQPSTPVVTPEQSDFTELSKVSIVGAGVEQLLFNTKTSQVVASGTNYEVIDNQGFSLSTISLTALPTSGATISATYTINGQSGNANDLKLVETKNGLIYLWNGESKSGVILPVQY